MNKLITVEEAVKLIGQGMPLSLAGPEQELDKLPAGNWIGGTIPYFMVATGGVVEREGKIFATDLSEVGEVTFANYGSAELSGICKNAPANGFSLTIIPAGSNSHRQFAVDAANFENAFIKPTVGWIAGVHLSEVGTVTPKVYDGRGPSKYEDRAVVAYVALPDDKLASIEIVNLFEPDGGDVLHFPSSSFQVDECEVNGKKMNFAEYIRNLGLEHGKLPLVGDFAGAFVNVSLQQVGESGCMVDLYAPVFPGVDYHFAKPVDDYAAAFQNRLAQQSAEGLVLSCNCILNFVFGELEGKAIGGMEGPVTFGEIAYQLLNQTMVAIRVY